MKQIATLILGMLLLASCGENLKEQTDSALDQLGLGKTEESGLNMLTSQLFVAAAQQSTCLNTMDGWLAEELAEIGVPAERIEEILVAMRESMLADMPRMKELFEAQRTNVATVAALTSSDTDAVSAGVDTFFQNRDEMQTLRQGRHDTLIGFLTAHEQAALFAKHAEHKEELSESTCAERLAELREHVNSIDLLTDEEKALVIQKIDDNETDICASHAAMEANRDAILAVTADTPEADVQLLLDTAASLRTAGMEQRKQTELELAAALSAETIIGIATKMNEHMSGMSHHRRPGSGGPGGRPAGDSEAGSCPDGDSTAVESDAIPDGYSF